MSIQKLKTFEHTSWPEYQHCSLFLTSSGVDYHLRMTTTWHTQSILLWSEFNNKRFNELLVCAFIYFHFYLQAGRKGTHSYMWRMVNADAKTHFAASRRRLSSASNSSTEKSEALGAKLPFLGSDFCLASVWWSSEGTAESFWGPELDEALLLGWFSPHAMRLLSSILAFKSSSSTFFTFASVCLLEGELEDALSFSQLALEGDLQAIQYWVCYKKDFSLSKLSCTERVKKMCLNR